MQTFLRGLISVVSLCAVSLAQAESLPSQLDVLTQLEEIRAEMQALRGELEVTQHQMSQLEQQQRDFYDDINQRLTQLSQAPAATVATMPVTPPVVSNTPAPGAYTGSEGLPAAVLVNTPAPVLMQVLKVGPHQQLRHSCYCRHHTSRCFCQ